MIRAMWVVGLSRIFPEYNRHLTLFTCLLELQTEPKMAWQASALLNRLKAAQLHPALQSKFGTERESVVAAIRAAPPPRMRAPPSTEVKPPSQILLISLILPNKNGFARCIPCYSLLSKLEAEYLWIPSLKPV
jgi:hypothetical protein